LLEHEKRLAFRYEHHHNGYQHDKCYQRFHHSCQKIGFIDIEALHNIYKGRPCYIIGSGPSLRYLENIHISLDGIIITLNHAIVKVEELGLANITYSMQKDGGDKKQCPNCGDKCNGMIRPKKAPLLLHEHESKNCFEDYPVRYLFDAYKLGFDRWDMFSANCAIKIALLMGCIDIKLVSFDSHIKDYRTLLYNKDIIQYEYYMNYLQQDIIMCELIKELKLEIEWIYPKEKV
jgi:hypothetical protein